MLVFRRRRLCAFAHDLISSNLEEATEAALTLIGNRLERTLGKVLVAGT